MENLEWARTCIQFALHSEQGHPSLLIYEFNFGIYSSCRAKPELIRSAGGWRAIWSQHGRTVRAFSQTADLSGACTDKLFSRARTEDFGS